MSNTNTGLTSKELTELLIRVMTASLFKLRTMKTIRAADRQMVMATLREMDVAGYLSKEKRSLMVAIHRECNRI